MTNEEIAERRKALTYVYNVMNKYGYKPIDQITGYLVSSGETYISTKDDARRMIS